MDIQIDRSAGFCWGVVRTVQIAEQYLDMYGSMYVLGNIIHNPVEVERLRAKGLETIDLADFERLRHSGARVLIRAHGAPPEVYRKAWDYDIELIDATCPVVTKLQERVKKYYDDGFQVVLFGKKDHAEVVGVRGVCNDDIIVVKTVEQALESVDMSRPTVLFSQTTMDRATLYAVRDALRGKVETLIVDGTQDIASMFHAKDTICGQVSGREDKLAAFAASVDMMVFVAGRDSSNGKVLYNVAKDANPRIHFVETVEEINPDWFVGARSVGISGATSTPLWLMEKVRQHIATLDANITPVAV